MPGARLPMRKIRDVLRLSVAGMSKRKIAASLGMSATAAGDCIRRARRAGVGWPLPEGLTEEALERRLYPPSTIAAKEFSATAKLGCDPSRTSAAGRDAAALVGGASRDAPRRLRL